jgi:uroporphyrinogen III methyltransferase/synthase
MKAKGTVYLVGAGPGDAGLLTLRGAELLRRADVVVYDRLVNPALTRLAPPGAELVSRGSYKGDDTLSQAEITRLLIARAKAGKTVVRLKGGDPYVFGRGAEEAEELAAAGVSWEVVPGVSSITAVPNCAGIPLTHREHCSSFTVFTGHGEVDDEATALRYDQMAAIPGTKVVLMGMQRITEWTRALLAAGVPETTPVAIVEAGTTGRQRTVQGTLATIAKLAVEAKLAPPTVSVLGEVVKLRAKLDWFERRPLFGQRIVVTRAREQAADLSRLLAEQGAEVLEVPTLKLALPEHGEWLRDAILELNSYDWLVFTSVNGVTEFFRIFFGAFDDLRDIGGVRIAAVGPATAAKLKELHLKVDLMPAEYTGAAVAKAFADYQDIENLRICLLRAEVANRELPEALEEAGAIVDDIPVYRTVAETEDPFGDGARLAAEGADWITFTSGSTVEHLHARVNLPELMQRFPSLKLASIGPETTKAIRALGLAPTVEAKQHTMEGLVAALVRAGRRA